MVSWQAFCEHILATTNVPLTTSLAVSPSDVNPGQADIVSASLNESLFVIAGPGSGKTTASALRVLKLLFVDGVEPPSIVATTFTRRAAAVLRSRIVEWGEGLRDRVLPHLTGEDYSRLERLDFNQLRVGTIDSIAQELLTEYRAAGATRPSPVDEHVYAALMMSEGVRQTQAANSRRLLILFEELGFNTYGRQLGLGGRASALVEIRQRLINDRIDRAALLAEAHANPNDINVGVLRALEAISLFETAMREREIFDFAGLNEYFLEALRSNRMEDFLRGIRFVLVDEYQDTNYLQETIYFELASAAQRNGGSICVVGDDDQSLYRFRGATVELFAGFRQRLNSRIGVTARPITLNRNYRSTSTIVNIVDEFARSDAHYQDARVADKPPLDHGGTNNGVLPLVGVFRQGERALASEVAAIIARAVNGHGVPIVDAEGREHRVQLNPERGSAGDIAVLFDSALEYSASDRQRFPLFLRQELEALERPIRVFNPRGQPLKRQPSVRNLLGLALLCLDPDGSIQRGERLGDAIQGELTTWRTGAQQFANQGPQELQLFVANWGRRHPTRALRRRRSVNVSLADVLYKLVTWIPAFQHDVEHLAWLEAVLRAVSAASLLRGFRGELVFIPNRPQDELGRRSVADAIWRVFAPIADGVIEVDEDLLETLPRNRVSFLTIHQAKGLEFPITIVDIGSELGDGRVAIAFKRYPTKSDRTHLMEDFFRRFSDIGLSRRDGVARAFDDLTRKYFVAFSRAQDLLIMVGDDVATTGQSRAKKPTPMRSVATGWRRPACAPDELWPWRGLPFLRRL